MNDKKKIDCFFFNFTICTLPPLKMKEQIERHATYKTYAGYKYHLNFPDDWILNELPETGRECWNCVGDGDHLGHAMWRKITLGYCSNCAMVYNGTRCRGFIGFGIEEPNCKYDSAFDLYLGYIDFDNFGDLADNPEHTMENACEFLADLFADHDDEDEDDDDERTETDYYCEDEDDFGECLHIGCGKECSKMSAYCSKHVLIYDK